MLRLLLFIQVLWYVNVLCYAHSPVPTNPSLPIPLKSLHVQGEFFDSFGEVVIRQIWTNDRNESITSKYKFTLDVNAVVSGFQMKIGDQSWKGVVKVKETARAEFTEAVASGVKSSLFEKISDTEYQVEIGPISPSESVEVEFHYLTHAAVNLDGSYRFVLPTNIAPKYLSLRIPENKVDQEYIDKMASMPYTFKPPYAFDVDLTWHTGSPLLDISSSTNAISTEVLSATAARVRCTTAPHDGDFSLVVKTKATTGAYSYQDEKGITYLYVHSQIPVEAVPSAASPKKITIVLDRSGSMMGGKIVEAVAAVDRFLSLVPVNPSTLLNFVSFGSHFNALYSHSVPATASNIATIRERLKTFSADYGGTELLDCLQSVVTGDALPSSTAVPKMPEPEAMEHVVLLLTDGQVYNHNSITDMLREKLTKESFRIMTIGIGRDADRKLVEQIADTTHALSRMLVDEADLTRALTDILSYIDKQYYTNMRVLDYEVSQVATVLYPAHPVNMFLRLSPAQYQEVARTGLTITAVNPLQGNTKLWHLPVSTAIRAGRVLEKLYADHTIAELSKQIDHLDHWAPSASRASLTASIVELSVAHGIMNKHTSYLVISDQQISKEELTTVKQTEVPQHAGDSFGGNIVLASGASLQGSSGSIHLTSGAVLQSASFAAFPGNVLVTGGSGTAARGDISISAGFSALGFATSSVHIESGSGSAAAVGGHISVCAGDSISFNPEEITDFSAELGGDVSIIMGGDSVRAGGKVSIVSGTGVMHSGDVVISAGHGGANYMTTGDSANARTGDVHIAGSAIEFYPDRGISSNIGASTLPAGSISIETGSSDMASGDISMRGGSASVSTSSTVPTIFGHSGSVSGEVTIATGAGSIGSSSYLLVRAGEGSIGSNSDLLVRAGEGSIGSNSDLLVRAGAGSAGSESDVVMMAVGGGEADAGLLSTSDVRDTVTPRAGDTVPAGSLPTFADGSVLSNHSGTAVHPRIESRPCHHVLGFFGIANGITWPCNASHPASVPFGEPTTEPALVMSIGDLCKPSASRLRQHPRGSLLYTKDTYKLLEYPSQELFEADARAVGVPPELFFQITALLRLDALQLEGPCEKRELLREYVATHVSAEDMQKASKIMSS